MSKLIYHILMRTQLVSKFLTFVAVTFFCAASLAAPSSRVPPKNLKNNSENTEQISDLYNPELISKPDVGPPIEFQNHEPIIIPSRVVRTESLSLALEVASNSQMLLSAGWQFMNENETANQFAAQISGNSYLGLEYERRHYLYPGKHQEPFWSYGLRLLEPTSDSMAGVLKVENYFATAAAGFEDILRYERRLNLRLQAALGTLETRASLSLGYVF